MTSCVWPVRFACAFSAVQLSACLAIPDPSSTGGGTETSLGSTDAESDGDGSSGTGTLPGTSDGTDETTSGGSESTSSSVSDSGSSGGDDTSTGSADDSTTSTGSASDSTDDGTEESSTGEPACPENPSGLAGVEPGYIWIANSSEGTISKIDTTTLAEVGRYLTRADAQGSPSRTSVNLDGDVVVANRSGGLAKFHTDFAKCTDRDEDGTVETSLDGTPIAWADEECRAWDLPLDYTSQRPVAWTAGTRNLETCAYDDERIWTSGVINDETIEVLLIDGDEGLVLDSVQLPEITPNYYGLYGAAVDVEGNMWASQLGQGQLVRVDIDDLTYEIWPMPASGYGMTIGPSGYVFTCSDSVARFNPQTETWATANVGGSGGCAEDGQGRLWLANQTIVAVDVETLEIVDTQALPEYVHGIGIDFAGYVWGVSMSSNAYRLDPVADTYDTITGLVSPYTYSDMTGFVLASVAQP